MSRLETRNLATIATNININRLQRNIVDLNPRGEAAARQTAEVKAALEMAANIHGINGLNEATLPNGRPSVTNSIIANGNCNCKNGFDGEKCDQCQISYGGFPTCHYGGKFIVPISNFKYFFTFLS